MENISLAVVTEDKEYGRALSLAMLNVCRDFIVRILTKEEFINERKNFYAYNNKGTFYKQFDLVLWDGEEVRDAYGDSIIFMAEKLSLAVRDFTGRRFCLYKYSPAGRLVADIFMIYSFLTGRRAVNIKRQEVRLLAFASWAGGTGCTTLAMSMAQELCRFKGSRTLYLSFEEIESTGSFIECHSRAKGVGVYLYHLFKGDREQKCLIREDAVQEHPFLEGYIVKDIFGVEAFTPTIGKNPLKYVNDKELQRFMASLIDSGRYDTIIMDLGSCLSEVGIACLEMAEKICVVSSSQEQDCREEQYFCHLICSCGENTMAKVIKVINMFSGEINALQQDEMIAAPELYIGINAEIRHKKDKSAIELNGQYGRDISMLAAKMTEPHQI